MRTVYTVVWFQRDDLPTETQWRNLEAARTFADTIFRCERVLAVKLWQGDNPEDPFQPVWTDDPMLLYKQIKPQAEEYFFHFQIAQT